MGDPKPLKILVSASIKATMDNLSDDALRLLFALLTTATLGTPEEQAHALSQVEKSTGTLNPNEFSILFDEVEAAIDRRFGPVPGY